MNSYPFGQTVRCVATFTVNGTLQTPVTTTCTIRAPDGTTTTPTPVSGGVGIQMVDVTTNQAGIWNYRFLGVLSNGDQAPFEGAFYIAASEVITP